MTTDTRAAMLLALRALEAQELEDPHSAESKAVAVLRAALAQPGEGPRPMSELPTLPRGLLVAIDEYGRARTEGLSDGARLFRWELLIDEIKAYARKVVAEQAGQPAAPTQAAAPVARPPLTDEQIEQAYKDIWRDLPDGFSYTASEWVGAGIRYAEKHHGIQLATTGDSNAA